MLYLKTKDNLFVTQRRVYLYQEVQLYTPCGGGAIFHDVSWIRTAASKGYISGQGTKQYFISLTKYFLLLLVSVYRWDRVLYYIT